MIWCKGTVNTRGRKCRAIYLDCSNIDLSGGIVSLVPDTPVVAVKRYRESGRLSQVIRIDMQLDFDAIRKVPTRFIDHYMPARNQKKPFFALKEKTAGIGQWPVLLKCTYAGGGK
jgi:hypothetical protein